MLRSFSDVNSTGTKTKAEPSDKAKRETKEYVQQYKRTCERNAYANR